MYMHIYIYFYALQVDRLTYTIKSEENRAERNQGIRRGKNYCVYLCRLYIYIYILDCFSLNTLLSPEFCTFIAWLANLTVFLYFAKWEKNTLIRLCHRQKAHYFSGNIKQGRSLLMTKLDISHDPQSIASTSQWQHSAFSICLTLQETK